MLLLLFLFLFLLNCLLFQTNTAFMIKSKTISKPRSKPRSKYNDINEKIILDLPVKQQQIIKKLNGFYGLIGPNIEMDNNINSLFELFTGNGIIQGVFFNKGKLTFVKHLIKTEKILYEEKNGIIPSHFIFTMFLIFLNKIKLFPNVMGMANTAILNVGNKNYALFERDHPYLIDIDFKEKSVNTMKKKYIDALQHFSGHSKLTHDGNIETIDYKVCNKNVNYYLLNKDFSVTNSVNFKFKYIPIVHDFYSNDKLLIMADSPLIYKLENVFTKKVPIKLDYNKETFLYIYNKKHDNIETYIYEKGFYIFHYACIKYKQDTIEIYASQYDDFDFTSVNIKGNYRMIKIDRKTKKVSIKKNTELEKYNLDFPILFKDKVISRSYENRRINGFVITKDLKICKELFYENKHICGEHSIVYIEKTPYLIFFNVEITPTATKHESFLSLVNLNNYNIINIKIHNKLNLGFHSVFIENSLGN